MKILICTSNATRHRFVANLLGEAAEEALIISECRKHDTAENENLETANPLIAKSLNERFETEERFFVGNESFRFPVIPILWKEINLPKLYEIVKKFSPDMIFVYGSSIIKEPFVSILEPGKTINMHLGLSPYYRGSGTNFWPFVNRELEYVGATLLHLDPGIDTGDIIAHVRPKIEKDDNVHTLGCKTIRDGAFGLVRLLKIVKEGRILPRHKQWKTSIAHYYETKDLTEEIMKKYYHNMETGMITEHLEKQQANIRFIPLP
ncbi:MAG: formyl transferase [Candidatus Paceibacterota bacterium]|jgi:hypothetical protein